VYGRYYTSVLLMYAHAVLGDFVSVRQLLTVADTAGSQAFWDLCTGDRLFFKGLVAGLDLGADDDDDDALLEAADGAWGCGFWHDAARERVACAYGGGWGGTMGRGPRARLQRAAGNGQRVTVVRR